MNLSGALLVKGELDGAIGSGRTAIRLQPENADAHYNLGLALKAKGDFNGALAAFREVLKLEPGQGALHYEVGQLLDRACDDAGALTEYRAMLARQPSHAPTQEALAVLLQKQGDIDGAIAAYRSALQAAPNSVAARVLLAGGRDSSGSCLGTGEVYDPKTDTFSLLTSTMKDPRSDHTATLLADGRVLLSGGTKNTSSVLPFKPLATAEVYDPKTDTFSPIASPMKDSRSDHTASLLADGRVLLAGGFGPNFSVLSKAAVYDPKTDTFSLLVPDEGSENFPYGDVAGRWSSPPGGGAWYDRGVSRYRGGV